MKQPAVYIMTNHKNGTLYIGVTSNLVQRVWQHKNNCADGFTKKYALHHLVYFEQCNDMLSAIEREKQLKKYLRSWKIELIGKHNPEWRDLYDELL